VVVVDNLSNSSSISLDRVAEICGLDEETRKKRLCFYEVDMCDLEAFRKVFQDSPQFDACIHFAGLKVRQSVLHYYDDGGGSGGDDNEAKDKVISFRFLLLSDTVVLDGL
jgi:UDP-glucose 4-epimerase